MDTVFLRISIRGLLLLLHASLLLSCAINPVSGRSELMLVSEENEIEIGRKTHTQIIKQYGTYDDSALNTYTNEIFQRLAKLSHRPHIDYQFKILDSTAINAFAVPGGYVYFTREILAHLNSEAELAGIMGHELGHITARHSAQQISRAQLTQVGLGIGMIFSETFRALGDITQLGTQMLFLRFSRDNERQADDLGIEYAMEAGYDAAQMANFFKSLEHMRSESNQSGLPDWFSTHPDPGDRYQTVIQRAGDLKEKQRVKNLKINRINYLKQIDGLIVGEDPRQGYVDAGTFYHPTLFFKFPIPLDWKLVNTRTVVQMISKNKEAFILFKISSARTPVEAAQQFAHETRAEVMESRHQTINGLPAYRLSSRHRTQKGTLGILSYFIEKNSRVYVFNGICSINRFRNYVPVFQQTMEHFDMLKDPKKIAVKPDRIQILTTKKENTLRRILISYRIPADDMKKTALLNGKGLEDVIPAHSLLKIVKKGR